jgi:hypothetical protein
MIKINLENKIVSVDYKGNRYNFTDTDGQIDIDKIIEFFDIVAKEDLATEPEYSLPPDGQVDEGLKLFISELFKKFTENKQKQEADEASNDATEEVSDGATDDTTEEVSDSATDEAGGDDSPFDF